MDATRAHVTTINKWRGACGCVWVCVVLLSCRGAPSSSRRRRKCRRRRRRRRRQGQCRHAWPRPTMVVAQRSLQLCASFLGSLSDPSWRSSRQWITPLLLDDQKSLVHSGCSHSYLRLPRTLLLPLLPVYANLEPVPTTSRPGSSLSLHVSSLSRRNNVRIACVPSNNAFNFTDSSCFVATPDSSPGVRL